MKCPKCGKENCIVMSETDSQGYDFINGCCCYILLGPLGLLCGACGMGNSTTTYWVCNDCGNKFQLSNKQIEKNAEEIGIQQEIESYALNLTFGNDMNLENLELDEQIVKSFINNWNNVYGEFTETLQKRIIDKLSNDQSKDSLRIKKIIYDSIGENKNFIENKETILFIFDNSENLDGKSGFIITSKNIYSKDRFFQRKTRRITSDIIIEKNLYNNLMIDGITIRLNSILNTELEILMRLIKDSLKIENANGNKFDLKIGVQGSNGTIKSHVLKYKEDIYYCEKEGRNKPTIYKTNDKNSPIKIYEGSGNISNLNVIESELYFIEEKMLQGADVLLVNLLNNKKVIIKNKIEKSAKLVNGKLYYSKKSNEIICMDLKTKNETILTKDLKSGFSIWNGYIYYINRNDACLYKIRLDGSEEGKIYSGNIGNVDDLVVDNEIVYYKKNDSLYKIDNDNTKEILKCQKLEQAVVCNDNIIFIAKKPEYIVNNNEVNFLNSEETALYIFNIKAGKIKILTYEECNNIYILNNKICFKAQNTQDLVWNSTYGVNCMIDPNTGIKLYFKDGEFDSI
ncbi:DUF5050 domain-containing protein [Clostridium sp. C2-6-12]|uniref:DUF5050 domain-containing protein n=1 Tax=Clostridium sp. C2-6-12 TaxID=2698832 RepID=UPI00136C47E7|nr:DUF5050 domain-containing protein [Clostridium sp. C2-6-12]